MAHKDRGLARGGMGVLGDDRGSAIVLTLLIITALSLTSLMALRTVLLDSAMMRNSRDYRGSLYRAETGLSLAAENHRSTWLASDSVLFDETINEAVYVEPGFTLADRNGDPLPVMGDYWIARFGDNPDDDSPSALFYRLGHKAPVRAGSGFSSRDFEIRRYGIKSTGLDPRGRQGVTVEAGLSKTFNRF